VTARPELAAAVTALGGPGATLERFAPLSLGTSYECSAASVRTAAGSVLDVFVKDFGVRLLPKRDPTQAREVERWAYRELLSRVPGLGTPRFHGSSWDPAGDRCWLFLELVHGTKLRELPFDHWVAAAAWLARMQARLSPLIAHAGSSIPRHDAGSYIRDAEAALRAARTYSTELAGDLEAVVATLRELAPAMAAEPFVLVHGSFWPRHVLVAEDGRRICVVDWERASLGSPLYDLDGLALGFEGKQLQDLIRAFVDSADRSGTPVSEGIVVALLDLFRLHYVLRTLAGALRYGFPPDAVARLTEMALALHARVA
jgi:hypothetical protein